MESEMVELHMQNPQNLLTMVLCDPVFATPSALHALIESENRLHSSTFGQTSTTQHTATCYPLHVTLYTLVTVIEWTVVL